MIKAKVIEDSVSDIGGPRLTTLELKYPRFIHAEFMTHRVFSRNASSSRAIPVSKLIDQVEDHIAMPIEWGSNRPGMQAGEELQGETRSLAQDAWVAAARDAIKRARELLKLGAHKQIVNRILEPFSHISVIVTATEWENFFSLRIHPAAQPEIRQLAIQMKEAMDLSTPRKIGHQEWHLPYITTEERANVLLYSILPSISAARCARVSYLTHDGLAPDIMKDLSLAENLFKERHASPFEHQACPAWLDAHKAHCNNFNGWQQHRSIIGL